MIWNEISAEEKLGFAWENEGPRCPKGHSTGLDTYCMPSQSQVLGVGDTTTDGPRELSLLPLHLLP